MLFPMHGSHGYLLGKFSTNRAKFNLQDFVCHPLVHREQEEWEGARSTIARPVWHLVISSIASRQLLLL
jgi:hypothetical protein